MDFKNSGSLWLPAGKKNLQQKQQYEHLSVVNVLLGFDFFHGSRKTEEIGENLFFCPSKISANQFTSESDLQILMSAFHPADTNIALEEHRRPLEPQFPCSPGSSWKY